MHLFDLFPSNEVARISITVTFFELDSYRWLIVETAVAWNCFKCLDVFILKIHLIPTDITSDISSRYFNFFPMHLNFLVSINKSQCQRMKVAEHQLEEPCYSHGQLYVGCSRVGRAKRFYLTVTGVISKRIVYREVHCWELFIYSLSEVKFLWTMFLPYTEK